MLSRITSVFEACASVSALLAACTCGLFAALNLVFGTLGKAIILIGLAVAFVCGAKYLTKG